MKIKIIRRTTKEQKTKYKTKINKQTNKKKTPHRGTSQGDDGDDLKGGERAKTIYLLLKNPLKSQNELSRENPKHERECG